MITLFQIFYIIVILVQDLTKLGYMRCMVECTPIKVLQLVICWPMTPSHHWPVYPMIIHTPLVAGNLPIKTKLVAR